MYFIVLDVQCSSQLLHPAKGFSPCSHLRFLQVKSVLLSQMLSCLLSTIDTHMHTLYIYIHMQNTCISQRDMKR